jgi:hypothetical protein
MCVDTVHKGDDDDNSNRTVAYSVVVASHCKNFTSARIHTTKHKQCGKKRQYYNNNSNNNNNNNNKKLKKIGRCWLSQPFLSSALGGCSTDSANIFFCSY